MCNESILSFIVVDIADVSDDVGYRVCQRSERSRSLGGSTQVFRNETKFALLFTWFDVVTDLAFSAFIRGLLENVGAEIDPVQLIRRIKNGLEIPGLKFALIKILQDYNLQVSSSPLFAGGKSILMLRWVDFVDGRLQDDSVQRLSTARPRTTRRTVCWISLDWSVDPLIRIHK